MRILLVEDDRKAARILAKGLTEEGFVVDVAVSGEEAEHGDGPERLDGRDAAGEQVHAGEPPGAEREEQREDHRELVGNDRHGQREAGQDAVEPVPAREPVADGHDHAEQDAGDGEHAHDPAGLMAVKVREKPKGSGVWWLFIDHAGKRKAKRVGTKRAATAAAEKIEAKLALGDLTALEPPRAPVPTFGEYAERWIDGVAGVRCQASTIEQYRNRLKAHLLPHLKSLLLTAITRERIRPWWRRRPGSGGAAEKGRGRKRRRPAGSPRRRSGPSCSP